MISLTLSVYNINPPVDDHCNHICLKPEPTTGLVSLVDTGLIVVSDNWLLYFQLATPHPSSAQLNRARVLPKLLSANKIPSGTVQLIRILGYGASLWTRQCNNGSFCSAYGTLICSTSPRLCPTSKSTLLFELDDIYTYSINCSPSLSYFSSRSHDTRKELPISRKLSAFGSVYIFTLAQHIFN